MRAYVVGTCLLAAAAALPYRAEAQAAARSDTVRYQNPVDGMPIAATLFLPPGPGPFPGVVLLTLAGVNELIERLNEEGWAVLMPERRGLATIEHLLRASFDDLAIDVRAGADYLRARPEVDPAEVGLLAQGGETMAALLAAVEPPLPAFVILMSTTGLPGDASYRIEQHRIAVDRNYGPEALAKLDDFLIRLTEMVIAEPSPGMRAFRTRAMLGELDIRLPINAAFPPNAEDQVRFYASTWWRDLFRFRPDLALARLETPVLVLMGEADPMVPWGEHLPAIERSLEEAPTVDATVCLLSGLLQHSMSPVTVSVVTSWLRDRLTRDGFAPRAHTPPPGCVEFAR